MQIRQIIPSDLPWITHFWAELWGSPQIIVHGQVFTPDMVSGAAAWDGETLLGLVTTDTQGDSCEVITLDSLRQQRGVGSALLGAAATEARQRGCKRLFLVTTNDNLSALAFYQKRGFRLCALRPGAVDVSRQLKPEIPWIGENDIPIHDELELEFDLKGFMDVELTDLDFG